MQATPHHPLMATPWPPMGVKEQPRNLAGMIRGRLCRNLQDHPLIHRTSTWANLTIRLDYLARLSNILRSNQIQDPSHP